MLILSNELKNKFKYHLKLCRYFKKKNNLFKRYYWSIKEAKFITNLTKKEIQNKFYLLPFF